MSEPVYKAHVITVDAPFGVSTQPMLDELDLGTPDDAVQPPESLERLAFWSQLNSTRRSCIEAMATNTVGLGFELERDPDHGQDDASASDPRERIREARVRLNALAARDERLESPTLTELLKAVKTDEEEVGWGLLEVSRDREGEVDGLFHLPAKRMRRLRSRHGYLLLPPSGDPTDATYYVPFGTKVVYDSKGSPTGELAEDHRGGWARNEVLVFKLYTSESRDYGLPRDTALALEYLGDKSANEANVGYFENGGALPTVLFIQGEETKQGGFINVEVPAEVTQQITSVLRSRGQAGPGAGRVAIVPLPQGVKAQKEVLGQLSERDLGHVAFREDVRQRTLSAFRLGGIFVALSGEGQYDAEVQRALAKEQVFDGEQERYESRISATILRDIGYPELRVRFHDLAVEDDAAKRSSAEKGSEVGAITWREYRTSHGWPPMPEAESAEVEIEWGGRAWRSVEPEPGQVPHGWNDSLMPASGRPDGADQRVVEGDDRRGQAAGLGGRGSRDRGQAASAQVRRLATANGAATRGGARRALERARTLPEEN